MHSSQLFALVAASMAATTQAITTNMESPIPGYGVFVPEWEVQATPGGESLLMNGTVEEVLDQLHAVNPTYEAAFGINFTAEEDWQQQPSSSSSSAAAGALEKRTDFSKAKVICLNFPQARVDAGNRGISYLRGVKGQPRNGAGPGNCGRVSCSHSTGIWWCNDDNKPKTLSSFGSIADGAARIWRDCTDNNYFSYFSSGQAFHHTNWNVIITGRDRC